MRCMYSKLMLSNANTLLIDSPTNHLDLEAIQAVNKGFEDFQGSMIIASHDLKLIQSVATKVVEIADLGSFEFAGTVEEYLNHDDIKKQNKETISLKHEFTLSKVDLFFYILTFYLLRYMIDNA